MTVRSSLLQLVKKQNNQLSHTDTPLNPVSLSTVVRCNQVSVQDRVSAVLGKIITLSCIIEVGSNLSLTQTSWERRLPSGTVTLAVFNPEFGISVSQEYERRVSFVSPSVRDASITISGASFADIGSYVCKVTTFPLGNNQATTFVDVLGKAERRCVFHSASPANHIPKGRRRLPSELLPGERGYVNANPSSRLSASVVWFHSCHVTWNTATS